MLTQLYDCGTRFLHEIFPPLVLLSGLVFIYQLSPATRPRWAFCAAGGRPSETQSHGARRTESENYIGGATLLTVVSPTNSARRSRLSISVVRPSIEPARAERSDENSAGPKKRATYQLQPSASSGHESLSFALSNFEVTIASKVR